jgi:hypothetical protein
MAQLSILAFLLGTTPVEQEVTSAYKESAIWSEIQGHALLSVLALA